MLPPVYSLPVDWALFVLLPHLYCIILNLSHRVCLALPCRGLVTDLFYRLINEVFLFPPIPWNTPGSKQNEGLDEVID